MNNHIKRLFAVLLVFSLLLLPSCSSISDYFDDYTLIGQAITPDNEFYLNETLDYVFDEEIITQIDKRFEKLDEMLEANDILRALPFVTLYAQQTSDLYYLADHAQLAYLKFCADPNKNNDSMDEYTRLSDLYTEYSARIIRMYGAINDSVYRFVIFGAWEDSEVELALALSESYSEEVVALVKERDNLVANYHKLNQNKSNFLTKSAEIYHEIVDLNNQIAKASGYDSYADYAYPLVYSRDYSAADAKKMHEYVKNYIVPLAKQLSTEVEEFIKDDKFEREYRFLQTTDLVNGSKEQLAEYYDLMYLDSNVFIDEWQALTVFGDENSYPAAFTISLNYYGVPVCYYGEGYQDAFTVIHEQGHFSAGLEMPGGYDSIDLCEVHSQGNEWLYFAYTKENTQYKECYEKIAKAMLLEDCLTIIVATACDMFEQQVYSNPPRSENYYDQVFENCLGELGAYKLLKEYMGIDPASYWHYAIVSNSMYYLSYAVSMIPSIEIYILAQEEGLETAAESYLALSEGDAVIGFEEALDYAGLSSPFEEEVYVRIKEHFN